MSFNCSLGFTSLENTNDSSLSYYPFINDNNINQNNENKQKCKRCNEDMNINNEVIEELVKEYVIDDFTRDLKKLVCTRCFTYLHNLHCNNCKRRRVTINNDTYMFMSEKLKVDDKEIKCENSSCYSWNQKNSDEYKNINKEDEINNIVIEYMMEDNKDEIMDKYKEKLSVVNKFKYSEKRCCEKCIDTVLDYTNTRNSGIFFKEYNFCKDCKQQYCDKSNKYNCIDCNQNVNYYKDYLKCIECKEKICKDCVNQIKCIDCRDHHNNKFNHYVGQYSQNINIFHILCRKCEKNIKSECKNCGELKCNHSFKYNCDKCNKDMCIHCYCKKNQKECCRKVYCESCIKIHDNTIYKCKNCKESKLSCEFIICEHGSRICKKCNNLYSRTNKRIKCAFCLEYKNTKCLIKKPFYCDDFACENSKFIYLCCNHYNISNNLSKRVTYKKIKGLSGNFCDLCHKYYCGKKNKNGLTYICCLKNTEWCIYCKRKYCKSHNFINNRICQICTKKANIIISWFQEILYNPDSDYIKRKALNWKKKINNNL